MQHAIKLIVIFCITVGTAPVQAAPPPIRGMAFGHHTDIDPATLERNLRELKDLGVSHVSYVIAWSIADVRSSDLARKPEYTTSDAALERMIKRAHHYSLKVLLFPIIDIRKRKPLEWRGTLKPENWDTWWKNYERYLMTYARIAARTKAEMLCVGSELVSTEAMRDRWQRLIKTIRTVYRGKLIYSANWDHYQPVSFWDLVDYVGLTGYYELTQDYRADRSAMAKTWREIQSKLRAWSKALKKPFVFTEIGYPSLDGGAVHPWDYTQGTAVDLDEQARAFQAFVDVWDGLPELQGVFFWDWYGEGGPTDKQYTPRKKPASDVIRAWFQSSAPTSLKRTPNRELPSKK